MNTIKRVLVIGAVFSLASLAAPAYADPPGGGDKQCVPGQNSQPQPGQKGGSCPPS